MELLKFLFNSLNNLTFSRNSLIPSEFQIYWRSHSSLPLIVSSAFWYAISLFLNSKYFLTSGAISTLAYRFFTGVLLNFQTFGEFLLIFVIILYSSLLQCYLKSSNWDPSCAVERWAKDSAMWENWKGGAVPRTSLTQHCGGELQQRQWPLKSRNSHQNWAPKTE